MPGFSQMEEKNKVFVDLFSCLLQGFFGNAAIIFVWHADLMNAFQPSLLCFSASHYQSGELISILAAGAIMRLLSLIYNLYRVPAELCCFSFPFLITTKTSLSCGFCFMSHAIICTLDKAYYLTPTSYNKTFYTVKCLTE